MLNKVMIAGYVGRDPELRTMPDGRSVANFSIATTERWKDKRTGEDKEQTEWHNIVAFERRAEVIGEYVQKGTPLLVEGKLKTRKWQDKQGNDRYTTEIVMSNFVFLPNPNRNQDAEPRRGAEERDTGSSVTDVDNTFNDDIPF